MQPQFLFYPQIIPYQQMPYHQQLPYQHQRMHNLLHNSNGHHITQYNNLHQNQNLNLNLNHQHSQNQNRSYHLRQPQHLLPHAPPSSQQHSSSSSFSSQQHLTALQQQTKQTQGQTQAQSQPQTTTQMPLFSGFSLRGSKQNKMARNSSQQQLLPQKPQLQQPQPQPPPPPMTLQASSVKIKPPPRKKDPADRNRGPVNPKDLAHRLHTIQAERGLQAAAGCGNSSATTSPLEPPPQLQQGAGVDRSGRRIRSRGSGNLRAVYASNAPIIPTTGGGSIRRQAFSAPHNLNALAPPPSLPELERRKNRTRSLSPQQVSMRGGGPAGATVAKPPSPMANTFSSPSAVAAAAGAAPTDATLAQRRAVTSVILPSHAHHGVPYVPSQAAQQFTRTTAVVGGPRKSILLQKPKNQQQQNQSYSHNQPVARSPPLSQKDKASPSAKSSAKSPVTPSSARAPSVQHAFKDTLAEPGNRRQSIKEGSDAAVVEDSTTAVGDKAEPAVEDAAADEVSADVEADLDTDTKAKAAKAAKKPVAASDFRRIVQEHSVDWTQSDETAGQRKREKKEKKEREKQEKKAKQQQVQQENGNDAEAPKQARPLWRLKARLSSFSRDKRSPSPPETAVAAAAPVAPVAEAKEDKVATQAPDVAAVAEAAPKVQEESASAVEDAKAGAPEVAPEATAVEAPAAIESTSNSPSVLSLTAMAKSSSFLSLFKH